MEVVRGLQTRNRSEIAVRSLSERCYLQPEEARLALAHGHRVSDRNVSNPLSRVHRITDLLDILGAAHSTQFRSVTVDENL